MLGRRCRGVEDRAADIWEALLAVADLAGKALAERCACSRRNRCNRC